MSSLALSALLALVDPNGDVSDVADTKRVQGRPARGENEVGVKKIVEGMQAALRALQNTKVSRKDVASHAGVTAALVTYYFPERTDLIEAATQPVVRALVDRTKACFEHEGPARQRLCQAIEVLLEAYTRDAAVIALYSDHRASTPDRSVPDLLKDLDALVEAFFEAWLLEHPGSVYDAAFLRKAMVGACRNLARRRNGAPDQDTDHLGCRGSAEMICSMLLGPTAREAVGTPALVGVGGP